MSPQEVTRRDLIRRGGTAVSAAGLVTGAGCSTRTDTRGPTTPTESSAPTSTPTDASDGWTGPEYGRWLPAPETVLPVSEYQFGMVDLTEYADHVGQLPPGLQGVVQNWKPVEVDWRTVPLSLTPHGNNVIRTDHDPDAVVDQVADTDGWTESGEHEGYVVLANGDNSKGIAVGDDAIVVAHGYGEGTPVTETARGIVDTARGRVPTYPGENAAVDAVMDEFDSSGFSGRWVPVEVFDASPTRIDRSRRGTFYRTQVRFRTVHDV